jgi:hypothetical protein
MSWLRGMVLRFRCAYMYTHAQEQIWEGELVIKHESFLFVLLKVEMYACLQSC